MNHKGINAVWLTRADLTNLNSGEGESNFIDVKKYKRNDIEYPYVSGQAMRFYMKEAIRRNLQESYMCLPNDKGETCGDITKCVLCDLFGFMTTIKGQGAAIRTSPVKVSPAIGLLPFDENSTIDFLTRRKFKQKDEKKEGDIVNVEVGTNIYKCGISIDAARVGAEEDIDQENRSLEIKELITPEEKTKRIKYALEALRYLADYSKQSRLLTDFTPDMICITLQNRYSHRLQKIYELDADGNINIERLNQILADVKDYSDDIYFGMVSGTIPNEEEVKKAFTDKGIEVKTPGEAIKNALAKI